MIFKDGVDFMLRDMCLPTWNFTQWHDVDDSCDDLYRVFHCILNMLTSGEFYGA